jgi:hypothetical protein
MIIQYRGHDMKAIVKTGSGGPEVLELVDIAEPVPASGEALVDISAAGINFMDIGVRQGMLGTTAPAILGVEGAGRVRAVGDGVDLIPGQRVAWVYAPGSYAQTIAVPAAALVPIPDAIDDRTAAAVMMQGLTASHFATDFYPVRPGDVALVHAAAGGLGLLLTQIVRLRGGTVIGRVSHPDKVAAAREAGADHVIVDHDGRFAEQVLALTGGDGADVVGACDLPGLARRASAQRHLLLVWTGARQPRPDRHHAPAEEHQARLRGLLRPYRHTRAAAEAHRATVRVDRRRRPEGADRRRLSAGRGGAGASRHRKPVDRRQAAAHPVTQRGRTRPATSPRARRLTL